ncbi:hypothetical protein BZA05DRAFT_99311 [Tricharina praecox]|uniref:uncharacterized protein n=1 Tax=Tricharina praecox TaxID=43433 RepID=UPI00221EB888|nr:uncharacterized protein BZA05DRAFT_99311 [Tricharina praecox]KAI5857553.1 hypothetical protein BZA05DRAFT_99311 [Tricharina praecox]
MPAHSSLDGPSPSSSLLQSPLPRPEDQKENSAGEYYTTASHTFKEYYSLHHQEPRHQENMDPLQGIYHGDRPFTPYDLVPNPERTYTSTPTSGASHSRPILRRKPGERRLNGIARNGEGQVSPTPSGCLTACSGGGGGGGGDSSGSGGTAGKERASLGGGGQQPSDTGDKSSRSGNNRGKEESSRDKSNDGSSGNNRAKPGLSAPTFKCPVACKARESDNVPKECRETFDTEQDAIDHCEQLHYLCPICKHAPPVQRDRKHSTLKTRPIIWRHYYFADTMGLK